MPVHCAKASKALLLFCSSKSMLLLQPFQGASETSLAFRGFADLLESPYNAQVYAHLPSFTPFLTSSIYELASKWPFQCKRQGLLHYVLSEELLTSLP